MSNILKNIVSTGAPLIATALGGPLAGAAVAALSKAIFGKSDASQDDIANAIAANPTEMGLKIVQAENEFKENMEKLNVDMAALQYSDVKDARNMAINSDGINKLMPSILAIGVTIGFFATVYVLMVVNIDADVKDSVYMMVGILGTAWIQVVSFFFGSSTGSREKGDLLNSIHEQAIKQAK
jgi:hypothetical protein